MAHGSVMANYPEWLRFKIQQRAPEFDSQQSDMRLSVLTSVYEKTDAGFFAETRDSVLQQTHERWEWIVLAHGPVPADVENVLQGLESDLRCKVFRLSKNLGLIGGMRFCLEKATGDYVCPLDADDLLTLDSLAITAKYIAETGSRFLYSDEDLLIDGEEMHPYLRPDWDPVLLVTSSYIWHLCALQRERALQLGVYSDAGANWCHDWDTSFRFYNAGDTIVHIPHVLHHWRSHAGSSTNKPDPESGSLKSQRYVLDRFTGAQNHPDDFVVEQSPIFRGAFEWWVKRLPVRPPVVDLLIPPSGLKASLECINAVLRRSNFPFARIRVIAAAADGRMLARTRDLIAGSCSSRTELMVIPESEPMAALKDVSGVDSDFVAICSAAVWPEGDMWPWECDKLFQFDSDTAVVAGRVLDAERRVAAGPEIFGFEGTIGSPDEGLSEGDPGYFALCTKQRCVSAPSSGLLAVRTSFLRSLVSDVPALAGWSVIGAWLGAVAKSRAQRVAYTPMFTGSLCWPEARNKLRPDAAEWHMLQQSFPDLSPDHRWYSRYFSMKKGSAYSIRFEAGVKTN